MSDINRMQCCNWRKLAAYRFESVHEGHHDVSSVVPLEIEKVDGRDGPKVDALYP